MKSFFITKSITSKDSLSLEKYLNDISRSHSEPLSPEEEAELARRIRQGDDMALEKLVKANLRFVVSVAKKYQHYGLTLNDLINEGNLGLIKAAQKFDETKGFKFISYAVWWIRQSILQAISEQSRIVRLPANKLSSLQRLNKIFSQLEQAHEREPSVEELAGELQVSSPEVEKTIQMNNRHVSTEASPNDEPSLTLLGTLEDASIPRPDDRLAKGESRSIQLGAILDTLPDIQATVLRLFYGIGEDERWTPEAIGYELGVSKDRVRKLRQLGLDSLKKRKDTISSLLYS